MKNYKTYPCVLQGGTSVRFRLYDKTVAMVNTHLSAHMDQVQIRDEEYWNIMSEQVGKSMIKFPKIADRAG